MDIRFLASSSAGNAYVIDDGETALLIECGIPYRQLQRALGFRLAELAGALVSHEHGDHSCSVTEVMAAGVDVYASSGTWSALQPERLHRAHPVAAGDPFSVGSWRVMPFPTVHDVVEPLGFYMASRLGPRVLYMTDTAYCRDRFAGLTHLLVEANYSEEILQRRVNAGEIASAHRNRILRNHMSVERLIEMLAANDLSRVEEIHLLHLSDGNSDEAAFQQRVAEATGKPVYIAPKRQAA